eukprot:scaffold129_cov254-Pinguiococcus_pyrenoidosus.AAC.20
MKEASRLIHHLWRCLASQVPSAAIQKADHLQVRPLQLFKEIVLEQHYGQELDQLPDGEDGEEEGKVREIPAAVVVVVHEVNRSREEHFSPKDEDGGRPHEAQVGISVAEAPFAGKDQHVHAEHEDGDGVQNTGSAKQVGLERRQVDLRIRCFVAIVEIVSPHAVHRDARLPRRLAALVQDVLHVLLALVALVHEDVVAHDAREGLIHRVENRLVQLQHEKHGKAVDQKVQDRRRHPHERQRGDLEDHLQGRLAVHGAQELVRVDLALERPLRGDGREVVLNRIDDVVDLIGFSTSSYDRGVFLFLLRVSALRLGFFVRYRGCLRVFPGAESLVALLGLLESLAQLPQGPVLDLVPHVEESRERLLLLLPTQQRKERDDKHGHHNRGRLVGAEEGQVLRLDAASHFAALHADARVLDQLGTQVDVAVLLDLVAHEGDVRRPIGVQQVPDQREDVVRGLVLSNEAGRANAQAVPRRDGVAEGADVAFNVVFARDTLVAGLRRAHEHRAGQGHDDEEDARVEYGDTWQAAGEARDGADLHDAHDLALRGRLQDDSQLLRLLLLIVVPLLLLGRLQLGFEARRHDGDVVLVVGDPGAGGGATSATSAADARRERDLVIQQLLLDGIVVAHLVQLCRGPGLPPLLLNDARISRRIRRPPAVVGMMVPVVRMLLPLLRRRLLLLLARLRLRRRRRWIHAVGRGEVGRRVGIRGEHVGHRRHRRPLRRGRLWGRCRRASGRGRVAHRVEHRAGVGRGGLAPAAIFLHERVLGQGSVGGVPGGRRRRHRLGKRRRCHLLHFVDGPGEGGPHGLGLRHRRRRLGGHASPARLVFFLAKKPLQPPGHGHAAHARDERRRRAPRTLQRG